MSPPTEDLTMTRPLASSGTRQVNLNLHKKVGIDPFQSFKLGKGKVSLRGMFEKWIAETGYSATHRSWKERFWNENELGNGQGGLVCCDSWGHKELDTTEWLNWTELRGNGSIPKHSLAGLSPELCCVYGTCELKEQLLSSREIE